MYQDAILEEIHRIREEYSRSFNHNLKALFADLQRGFYHRFGHLWSFSG